MSLITPNTHRQRKKLFVEVLLNNTDKVNKVSDNSVLSGVAYGISKVAGKAEKDIAIALAQLFPDSAFSSQLDQVAEIFGVATRFSSSGSSTFVRVVGNVGTTYTAGVNTFQSIDGITFDIEQTVVIGVHGFAYVKVRSTDTGTKTNVPPNTINRIVPAPSGHRYCINEWGALGGRDIETDEEFRKRIKDGSNILAKNTIATIEQVFMLINPNILSVRFIGTTLSGKTKIGIITQNGIALNQAELNEIYSRAERFFSFVELRPFGSKYRGVELVNIESQFLDISFRGDFDPAYNLDDIRINIQTLISQYLDFRYFNPTIHRIEWDYLLQLTQSVKGVRYVPDQYFFPNSDVIADKNKVVRLRGFAMLNLNGQLLRNLTGTLNPVFYPNQVDFSFQSTVLRNI